MIKKAVYRSLERRVRGEDDKIPPVKKVAPDLLLDALRNMDIRVDPWSAPTCAPPSALRIRPAQARTSGAQVSRGDVPGYERAGPVPPATGSPRAKYSDEWYLSPPHRVAELVRKASTHRYLSFNPETEHIASEMRLILRSDKGKGRRALPSLPPTACPAFHGARQVYARMEGGPTLPDATYSSSADRSAVLDEYGIRIHELCSSCA
jgi:hypothetical protein